MHKFVKQIGILLFKLLKKNLELMSLYNIYQSTTIVLHF